MLAAITHVVVDRWPHEPLSVLQLVPVATAVVAAVAAAISWRAVRQARKIWERSLLPVLNPLFDEDGLTLTLIVGNVSKTLAGNAGWAVLWGSRRAEGHVGSRYLRPDAYDRVPSVLTIRQGIDDVDGVAGPVGIVWCRRPDAQLHVWSTGGQSWVLKGKDVRGKYPVDLLTRLIDNDAATAIRESAATGML